MTIPCVKRKLQIILVSSRPSSQICAAGEKAYHRKTERSSERTDRTVPKWGLVGSHAGRRTFICNALMMGISPTVVMQWTGHSDYRAMRPYIAVADQSRRDAMAAFDRLNGDDQV